MSYRAILDEHLAQNGYLAKPILEVGDTHLICDLLMQEAALSFLPEFVAREYLDQGLLVRLDVQELETTISRQLIYPRNKWISPELQCVIDHLTE